MLNFLIKIKNNVFRAFRIKRDRPPQYDFSQEWILETFVAFVHSQMTSINVDSIFTGMFALKSGLSKVLHELFLPYLHNQACSWGMPSPVNLLGPSGLFRSYYSHGNKLSQATKKGSLRKSLPGRLCHK